MIITKNDPKYKIIITSKKRHYLTVGIVKSARTTKTQNHTFWKFL